MKLDPSEVYAKENRNTVELMLYTTMARDVIEKELAKAWRAGEAAGVANATKVESEVEKE